MSFGITLQWDRIKKYIKPYSAWNVHHFWKLTSRFGVIFWFAVADPGHIATTWYLHVLIWPHHMRNVCIKVLIWQRNAYCRSSIHNKQTKSRNVFQLLLRLKSLMPQRMLLVVTCLQLQELSVHVGPRCDCRPDWTLF